MPFDVLFAILGNIICSFALYNLIGWYPISCAFYLLLSLSLFGCLFLPYVQVSIIFWSVYFDFHQMVGHLVCLLLYLGTIFIVWCACWFIWKYNILICVGWCANWCFFIWKCYIFFWRAFVSYGNVMCWFAFYTPIVWCAIWCSFLHFTLSLDGVQLGVLVAIFGNMICSQPLYILRK